MNRNYRAQGRSTAHILQLFNKQKPKPYSDSEESKPAESAEPTTSPPTQKNTAPELDSNHDL